MLFQSVGRGREASVTAMARHGLFFIPLVLVLPQVFGLLGLQMSQPVSDLLTFLLSLILGRSFLRWLQKMPGGMPDAPQGAKTEAFSES
jgi:Na+-driven multidrug efflux pump